MTAVAAGSASTGDFHLTSLPDAPAQITILNGTLQSTHVGTAFGQTLQVRITDQYGNPISNTTVTFAAPATGPGTSFPILTASTDVAGVATLTATANTAVGSFSVTASVVGLITTVSFAAPPIPPGTPAQITIQG